MTLLILAAAIGTMRLHLWFHRRHEAPGIAPAECGRAAARGCDGATALFAACSALGGVRRRRPGAELAAVCLACAAGNLVAAK